MILSMSTGGGFVPYLMTALEPGLRLWSPPVPILGLGADRIDTAVVKVGATYHAFTKNETKKVIEHAVSGSLVGAVPIRRSGSVGGSPGRGGLPWSSCRTATGGSMSTPIGTAGTSTPTVATGCGPGRR